MPNGDSSQSPPSKCRYPGQTHCRPAGLTPRPAPIRMSSSSSTRRSNRDANGSRFVTLKLGVRSEASKRNPIVGQPTRLAQSCKRLRLQETSGEVTRWTETGESPVPLRGVEHPLPSARLFRTIHRMMKRHIGLVVAALLPWLLASCMRGEAAKGHAVYQAKGVVRKVMAETKSVTIAHENIPGYMEAMTMDFSVTNATELTGLRPG